MAGQDDWTYLSVPITVRPLDPQPELRAGSMTVGPGETATFDLRKMTTWQLREDWEGIRYALDYAGSAFDVSLEGSIVTVVGADRAVPGVGGGGDRLGHEPRRRLTGPPHHPRRRRAVDAPAGRVAHAAVQPGLGILLFGRGHRRRRERSTRCRGLRSRSSTSGLSARASG